MAQSDTSEDEIDLPTPVFLRKPHRSSPGSHDSPGNSLSPSRNRGNDEGKNINDVTRTNRNCKFHGAYCLDVVHAPVTPSSVASSSVIFGQIPDEVLRVWSQLPEAIRLDPSLAVFQREYDRVNQKTEVKWVCNKNERNEEGKGRRTFRANAFKSASNNAMCSP